jgi:hypothetical protein
VAAKPVEKKAHKAQLAMVRVGSLRSEDKSDSF